MELSGRDRASIEARTERFRLGYGFLASSCVPFAGSSGGQWPSGSIDSHGAIVDGDLAADVYLHPPLLEACSHIIGEPFKLSSFLARTLRGKTPAQDLHADLARGSEDAPLLGFILMIDSFCEENGATRFVPTSHTWAELPCDRLSDTRAQYPGEVLGCGERGTMIAFNEAIWHGHTANVTPDSRRSIQGYFVRRSASSEFDFRDRLLSAARSRLSPLARYLLALDDEMT
jgi:hypothetical protein